MEKRLEIRPAVPDDAGVISEMLKVIARLHSEGRPDIYSMSGKYGEREVREMIEKGESLVNCAVLDGRVAGYAIAQIQVVEPRGVIVGRKIYYLDDLFVDESARGCGVGRALIEYCRAQAIETGCGAFELHVMEFNEGARKFYEKCGLKTLRRTMELSLEES